MVKFCKDILIEEFIEGPKVRPKRDYRNASSYLHTGFALDRNKIYDYTPATNLPDWKKKGKIFVYEDEDGESVLLEKGEYEMTDGKYLSMCVPSEGHLHAIREEAHKQISRLRDEEAMMQHELFLEGMEATHSALDADWDYGDDPDEGPDPYIYRKTQIQEGHLWSGDVREDLALISRTRKAGGK
jgi:hypothetical protein